jgi:predicted ABC-type ATPase
MSAKRMRIFAGPNGSGKTTIIKKLQAEIPFGVYINADDIEQMLSKTSCLFFNAYNVIISEQKIQTFFKQSQFSPLKRGDVELWKKISVKDNVLTIHTHADSYLAADIAEFLRQEMLEYNISFTYETVMSHNSKLDFFQKAIDNGYRVYLYYIATEDPEINLNRVNVRVSLNGHNVAPDIIKSRYYRSLENLKSAVMKTNRSYIFDNSGNAAILIAEVTDGADVKIIDTKKVPNWFVHHLLSIQ